MNTSPASQRISIIGAGPGGLTLARVLQQRGIAVSVYDRDSDASSRNQGGSLDLHEQDGQIALREAGLLDEFFALARFDAQEMRQVGSDGRLLEHHVPEPGETATPEIDRGQLRELLLNSLEPGTVQWGHALESVGPESDGGRTLTFTDGTTVGTDLVVGADGGSSRVRAAVSPATPRYTGMTFLEAWFDELDSAHADLAVLVGNGGLHATDGTRGLFAQRNSGGHLRVYIMRKAPADWIAASGLHPADTAGIRAHLLREYADWSPGLRGLIADNDGVYVDRPLFALPVPHTWQPSSTVTLLGDAAHLMPPLGYGVNLAMLDASELALAIATTNTLDEAVRRYESTMIPRSVEIAGMLEHGAEMMVQLFEPETAAELGVEPVRL